MNWPSETRCWRSFQRRTWLPGLLGSWLTSTLMASRASQLNITSLRCIKPMACSCDNAAATWPSVIALHQGWPATVKMSGLVSQVSRPRIGYLFVCAWLESTGIAGKHLSLRSSFSFSQVFLRVWYFMKLGSLILMLLAVSFLLTKTAHVHFVYIYHMYIYRFTSLARPGTSKSKKRNIFCIYYLYVRIHSWTFLWSAWCLRLSFECASP